MVQKKRFDSLLYVLIILYMVLMILRPRYSVSLVLFAILLLPILILFGIQNRYFQKKHICIVMLLIYSFLVSSISEDIYSGFKYTTSLLILLSPIFLSDILLFSDVSNKNNKKKTIIIISIAFLYCIIASFLYLSTNVMAIRNMASDSGEIDFAFGIIGGGYPLVFGIAMLIPFIFYASFYKVQSGWMRLCLLAIVFALFLFLIKCDVTIAFILSAIFCVPVLFVKNRKNLIAFLLLTVIAGLLLVILKDVISAALIDFLSLFNPKAYIIIRLKELATGDLSAGGRANKILTSLKTIIRYPIFGVGVRVGFDYYSLEPYTGSHSDLFDVPAKYGIPFAIVLYYVLFEQYRKVVSLFNDKEARLLLTLFIFMICSSVLDPVLNTNMLLVFYVIIPMTLQMINQGKSQELDDLNKG